MDKDEEQEERNVYTIVSPLKAWPGKLELPGPDFFTGKHWNWWRSAIKKRENRKDTINRILAYAGLEFLSLAGGDFDLDTVTLAEVQAWEKRPTDEHVKLISWLGREFQTYIQAVTDPKE